jgi:hypothetical protein
MDLISPDSLCPPEERHLLHSTDSSYDSELWLTAHTQLLLKRQHEVSELSKDLEMLNEMYKDLNLRVESQQEDLNLLQDHVVAAGDKVVSANKELATAQSLKSSNISLKLVLLGIATTGIAAGSGGIGLLIGLKPLTILLVSSGCTFLTLGATFISTG